MSGGISNIYIEGVLGELKLKYWNGVYSSDTIPQFQEENFAIIVNFSKVNETGSHFVALARIEDEVFLFDSLATPKDKLPRTIYNFMNQTKARTLLNFPIQDIISEYCGFYTIYFILLLSVSPKLRHKFSPSMFSLINLKGNDDICISLIQQMIDEIKQ